MRATLAIGDDRGYADVTVKSLLLEIVVASFAAIGSVGIDKHVDLSTVMHHLTEKGCFEKR